jgi:hypothetical protein
MRAKGMVRRGMSEKWIDRAWKDFITENVDDAILFFKPDLAALVRFV